MAHIERNGKRKTRDQMVKRRAPELGYYFIVTDTEETEQNYEKYLSSINDVSQLQIMLDKAAGYGYKKIGFIL
jgi:hypothetical protein